MLTREKVQAYKTWCQQQERDSATIEVLCSEFVELAEAWLSQDDAPAPIELEKD
jgi:hypothetical protein